MSRREQTLVNTSRFSTFRRYIFFVLKKNLSYQDMARAWDLCSILQAVCRYCISKSPLIFRYFIHKWTHNGCRQLCPPPDLTPQRSTMCNLRQQSSRIVVTLLEHPGVCQSCFLMTAFPAVLDVGCVTCHYEIKKREEARWGRKQWKDSKRLFLTRHFRW